MRGNVDKVLSNGYILGTVQCLGSSENYSKDSVEAEIGKFKQAISVSLGQIHRIKRENKELEEYLAAQELMISDPNLEKRVLEIIKLSGESAICAVRQAMDEFILGLTNSTSGYLKERAADLEDVSQRIIANLEHTEVQDDVHPYILFVDTLYPSYLISHKEHILGVIAKQGGYTSHTAILCRSWDIPFVISSDVYHDKDIVIIDTAKKIIIKNPNAAEVEEYSKDLTKRLSFEKKAVPHGDFLFLANVGSNLDLKRVLEYNFDGIGLYRTEMIFMNTNRPYSFLEQYEIYRKCVESMGGKFVCFRTFDIGDDKQLPYLKSFKKGIDNYKNNPLLFIDQVKALLKANIYGNMRIMFPMIETREEFLYLRRWVLRIREENKFNMPKIGMMLETKEALEHIEDFKEADFISIGTNDLTSELYNVNRDNAISFAEEYIQDFTDKLKKVVDFCDKNKICLSVCGELASVRSFALLFYKIGIKNLSVSPSAIRMLNLAYTDYADNHV